MKGEDLDYKSFLHSELERRRERNPRYSLRAFARDLKVSPSRLHDVLHGRYGLSAASANEIATNLNLSEREAELFCALVEKRHGRSREQRSLAKERLNKLIEERRFRLLKLDLFQLVADWHHFAILELAVIEPLSDDAERVAQKLDISIAQAQEALERLRVLGLLKEDESGLVPSEGHTEVGESVPNKAVQSYHRQIMDRASDAIEEQSVENREFGALTLAFSKEQLPRAKRRIQEFQKEFEKEFGDERVQKESVYNLSLQFFRLDKEEADREEY